jgi:hypothetical protein
LAAQVGDDFHQRMVVGQLGVPVGAQDKDPPAAGSHHVAQQEQRRLRRPLKVVEHEQQGFLDGGDGQPGGHGVEEPIALGLRVGPERGREARNPLAQLGYQTDQLLAIATHAA